MSKRSRQPALELMDAEILAVGVTTTPYAVGERLVRLDYVDGGVEPVTLVANPLPGSILARVARADGSEFEVRVPYLYRDDDLTRAYMEAEVAHWRLVQEYTETLERIDPLRGHAAHVAARPLREKFAQSGKELIALHAAPGLHPYPYPFRAPYVEPREGRTSKDRRRHGAISSSKSRTSSGHHVPT